MDFVFVVGGDELYAGGVYGIFWVFFGGVEEEFVEEELQFVAEKSIVAIPGAFVEVAGFEVYDGDGFGFFVDFEVVDFAFDGDVA